MPTPCFSDASTSGDIITDFSKGAGADVLQLHEFLTAIMAPYDDTAFGLGYLEFVQSGSNTLVEHDRNGSAGDIRCDPLQLAGDFVLDLD